MIFPVDDIDSGNVQRFTAREISELEILTYVHILCFLSGILG